MVCWNRFLTITICGACCAGGADPGPNASIVSTNPAVANLQVAEAEATQEPGILPDWGGVRSRWSRGGVDFSVSYTGEGLANVHGGLKEGIVYEGLLKAGIDLETEPTGLWDHGHFHISMVFPHGEGLTEKHLGDIFTFSNIDAPNDPRLFEFWYEHGFAGDRLSLRIGQLAADEEFASTDYGSILVNGTCGWPAIIAVNAPSPAYPVATPGARLRADLGHGWSLSTAVYNGQPCPENSEGQAINDHGLYLKIKDAFSITELRGEWSVRSPKAPLHGSARLGAWFHSGDFDDQRYDQSGLSLGHPSSDGTPQVHQVNWGLYLALEQQLTCESEDASQGLGTFARLGFAPPERNSLEFYVEAGLAYEGLLPNRNDDALALAMVYGQMSRHARALGHDCNRHSELAAPLPDYEMILEMTYKAQIRPGLMVQPVLGWVVHPGGSDGVRNAVVIGMRTSMDL